ncbi:SDR family oxidoreductase [Mycobacterium sp. Y57]|uniref:SDR family NAD(P)-dependent oxidoreductase n=1 Tax=Mycolicibacterium xanthum TaxID=2796469 RepID=UPI001C8415B2|nr:SDR family NAD(P)-dependent oxidoreductase [Mycolicibacterium xanthum]MBX7433929.1 SDR family oxidoreductase [Mycolicibacterium xanthum]
MSRVAVVSGGASGIGAAISRRFARRGDKVAILDQRGDTLKQHVSALSDEGADVRGYEVDVTDRSAVQDAIGSARRDLGPIDIVVTSAGITAYAPFTELSIEEWERTLAINLTGTFNCIQAAIPDMIDAGWGRVVTISSTAGQAAAPGQAHYVASKGGVIALTRALAAEFAGNGITVNTIPPALVDTPMARAAEADGTLPAKLDDIGAMLPLKRVGTAEDVAAACEFLCSEDAGYITGQQINVNGGIYM